MNSAQLVAAQDAYTAAMVDYASTPNGELALRGQRTMLEGTKFGAQQIAAIDAALVRGVQVRQRNREIEDQIRAAKGLPPANRRPEGTTARMAAQDAAMMMRPGSPGHAVSLPRNDKMEDDRNFARGVYTQDSYKTDPRCAPFIGPSHPVQPLTHLPEDGGGIANVAAKMRAKRTDNARLADMMERYEGEITPSQIEGVWNHLVKQGRLGYVKEYGITNANKHQWRDLSWKLAVRGEENAIARIDMELNRLSKRPGSDQSGRWLDREKFLADHGTSPEQITREAREVREGLLREAARPAANDEARAIENIGRRLQGTSLG